MRYRLTATALLLGTLFVVGCGQPPAPTTPTSVASGTLASGIGAEVMQFDRHDGTVKTAARVFLPAAAGNSGSLKQSLLYGSFGSCASGATSGTPFDHAFVVMNRADGNVSAEIHLQDAPANGLWDVRLVQTPFEGSGGTCEPPSGVTISTNRQGNGNLHFSEPILPGNTGAFVLLVPLNAQASTTGFIANVGGPF